MGISINPVVQLEIIPQKMVYFMRHKHFTLDSLWFVSDTITKRLNTTAKTEPMGNA